MTDTSSTSLSLGARPACVVNEQDMKWLTIDDRGADLTAGPDGQPDSLRKVYNYRRKTLGRHTNGKQLGCSLFEVEPGATAFPYHAHAANEESVYVLSGKGTMRVGDVTFAVSTGDYCTFQAGKGAAHQLINTSNEVLRYLCISTNNEPDVMLYPESNKIGISASALVDEKLFFPASSAVPYFVNEGKIRDVKPSSSD